MPTRSTSSQPRLLSWIPSFYNQLTSRIYIKLLILAAFLIIYLTEHLVSLTAGNQFRDIGFELFTPLHDILIHQKMYWIRVILFGIQTVVISFVLIMIAVRLLLYNQFQLGVEVVVMYFSRIIGMTTFVLPNPEGVIWHFPGIPETLNDYFFSGHIAVSIIVAKQLYKMGWRRSAWMLGGLFNMYQIVLFLVTRSHYSADCLCGVFAGLAVISVSELMFGKQTEKEKKQ